MDNASSAVPEDRPVPPADVEAAAAKVADDRRGVEVDRGPEVTEMPSEATEYEDSRAMFSAASAIQLEKVLDIADVWCVHATIFSFLPLPGRGPKCCDERVCTSVCPL